MTDRFDAQLRQHLLGTAEERPAEGQLAAIVAGVAATRQRRGLVARLTWNPDRVGPLPSRTLRLALLVAALAAALAGGALLAGIGAPRPSTVFEGTWTSVDPGDGSVQGLVVGSGLTPTIHFQDEYATGAACVADRVKFFTADGTGLVSGNQLEAQFPNGGGCGLQTVAVALSFVYIAASDTIVDHDRVTWTRVGGGTGPASLAPVPLRPSPAPTPVGRCQEVPSGGTYRGSVGPLTLAATIPAAGAAKWAGARSGFYLSSTQCDYGGGTIAINASIVTEVIASCEADARVDVSTPAEAVAALAKARGIGFAKPTSLTIGGRAATRFVLTADGRLCYPQVRLWGDGSDTVDQGTLTILYIVDVDSVPLAVRITNAGNLAPSTAVAEAESMVASLVFELSAPISTPASEPTPRPDADCIQFDHGGTYTAPAGDLSLSVTMPDQPRAYWSGNRAGFSLERAPCLLYAPLRLEASFVSSVYDDACLATAVSPVHTAAEAAAALRAQKAIRSSEPVALTVDGHSAVRLDIVTGDYEANACAEGDLAIWQDSAGDRRWIDPGLIVSVELVDFDDSVVAVVALRWTDEDPIRTLPNEIDAILGSLRIGRT
jgi:hypothetical protein